MQTVRLLDRQDGGSLRQNLDDLGSAKGRSAGSAIALGAIHGCLTELMPRARFVADNGIIDRMQKIRSPREIEMFRAAAQLISIGTQAPTT